MIGAGIQQVAAPVVGWVLSIGLVIIVLVLLNRRDRLRAELLDLVSSQFDPAVLRSNVAITITAGFFRESGLVIVEMPDCSQEEAQEVFVKLSKVVPSAVGLLVRGAPRSLGQDRRASMRGRALSGPARRPLRPVATARGHGG